MNNNRIKGQLWQLIAATFKEHIREPGVIFWGIVFPILMSVGLGLAFTQKAAVTRKVAIIEPSSAIYPYNNDSILFAFLKDYGSIQRNLAQAEEVRYILNIPDTALGNTLFTFEAMTWDEATRNLKKGSINIILVIKNNNPEYYFDPANSDAQLIFLRLSNLYKGSTDSKPAGKSVVHPLTVTGTRYIDFLVPGLIAMGVMMSCMWGLSYGIVEKRSKKLLRRMIATPMNRSYFLSALVTVRLGLNVVEALLLFIFVYFAFGITITGSLPALLLLYIAGNIGFAGIAILLSSHTSNTEIANGMINAVVMPMMILSGIFFSYHNFPGWSIPLIQVLPLTILADGIRSIFIEGSGLLEVIKPVLVLTLTGLVFATAGLRLFKWH